MKRCLIGIIVCVAVWFRPERVLAVDPATLLASDGAASTIVQEVGPALKRGVTGTTEGVAEIVTDALGVLYLPLGAVESTIGAPFGGFGPGMGHIGKGIQAPFKVLFDVVKLPARVVGG